MERGLFGFIFRYSKREQLLIVPLVIASNRGPVRSAGACPILTCDIEHGEPCNKASWGVIIS